MQHQQILWKNFWVIKRQCRSHKTRKVMRLSSTVSEHATRKLNSRYRWPWLSSDTKCWVDRAVYKRTGTTFGFHVLWNFFKNVLIKIAIWSTGPPKSLLKYCKTCIVMYCRIAMTNVSITNEVQILTIYIHSPDKKYLLPLNQRGRNARKGPRV